MNALHYIGFDVHKKTISFWIKTGAGEIVEEGSLLAQRAAPTFRVFCESVGGPDHRSGFVIRIVGIRSRSPHPSNL